MKFVIGRQQFQRQGWVSAAYALLVCTAGLAGSGLAGCSPANFFHQREGGEIAKPQQPTPGANQPYPNLASVPPAPTPPNQAELAAITNGLIADRAHAQYLAENAPLPDPSSPQASPGLFGIGTASPPAPPTLAPRAGTGAGASAPPSAPSAGTATASLPAATAPPPPPEPPANPPPPARAPVAAVQSTPLPAVTPPAPAAATPGSVPRIASAPPASAGVPAHAPSQAATQSAPLPTVVPPTPSAVAPGPVPQIANTPPPPPAFANVPAQAPARTTVGANAVDVAFGTGSSALTEGDVAALKSLAARRGNKVIEALGRGDAPGNAPATQAQAVTLGFARAQAIAKALRDAGVPESAIQVMSLANGRGGAAQLVE